MEAGEGQGTEVHVVRISGDLKACGCWGVGVGKGIQCWSLVWNGTFGGILCACTCRVVPLAGVKPNDISEKS